MESKIIVITGAGGILCSSFAKHLAGLGHKVAVLDLNAEAAEKVASEIRAEGGIAKAYAANVLEKDNLEAVHEKILADLGITPPLASLPHGVTCHTREDEDALYLFVENYNGTPATVDIGPRRLNLESGEYEAGEITLPPFGVKIYKT